MYHPVLQVNIKNFRTIYLESPTESIIKSPIDGNVLVLDYGNEGKIVILKNSKIKYSFYTNIDKIIVPVIGNLL